MSGLDDDQAIDARLTQASRELAQLLKVYNQQQQPPLPAATMAPLPAATMAPLPAATVAPLFAPATLPMMTTPLDNAPPATMSGSTPTPAPYIFQSPFGVPRTPAPLPPIVQRRLDSLGHFMTPEQKALITTGGGSTASLLLSQAADFERSALTACATPCLQDPSTGQGGCIMNTNNALEYQSNYGGPDVGALALRQTAAGQFFRQCSVSKNDALALKARSAAAAVQAVEQELSRRQNQRQGQTPTKGGKNAAPAALSPFASLGISSLVEPVRAADGRLIYGDGAQGLGQLAMGAQASPWGLGASGVGAAPGVAQSMGLTEMPLMVVFTGPFRLSRMNGAALVDTQLLTNREKLMTAALFGEFLAFIQEDAIVAGADGKPSRLRNLSVYETLQHPLRMHQWRERLSQFEAAGHLGQGSGGSGSGAGAGPVVSDEDQMRFVDVLRGKGARSQRRKNKKEEDSDEEDEENMEEEEDELDLEGLSLDEQVRRQEARLARLQQEVKFMPKNSWRTIL